VSVEQKDSLATALELERESARYTADRARRQYDAADPANRLVADELERRWEMALRKVADIDERLASARATQQNTSLPSLEEFRELAKDFGTVWNAPNTSIALKKRIVRALIEEIVVDIDPIASRIDLVFHWKGGLHSSASVAKFGSGQKALDLPVDVVEVISILARVCSDKTIAAYLTRSGIKPATGTRWTWKKVASARNHRGIPPASKQPKGAWLTLGAAAKNIALNRNLLSEAASRGLVAAEHPLPNGPWIFAREALSKLDVPELTKRLRNHRPKDAHEDSSQLNLAISTTSLKGVE
jgi:hypothetical protein